MLWAVLSYPTVPGLTLVATWDPLVRVHIDAGSLRTDDEFSARNTTFTNGFAD
jgi:hypothetical protein